MPLLDYITDRRNRIKVGATAGVGLLVSAGVAGVITLFAGQNLAGIDTFKDLSDGSREQSGSLLIRSGSTVLHADAVNRRVGIGKSNPRTELEVVGHISGSTLYVNRSMSGAGLTDCDTSGTSKLLFDITTGRFSCGTDQNSGTSYTAGKGLSLNGTAFSVNETLTGSTLRFLTVSGAVVYGKSTLASSGTLVFEGAASGSSLYLGTSLEGAGLTSCSNGATSKLLWNSGTKRFSCGTDADTSQSLFETVAVSGQSSVVADSATDTLTLAAGTNVSLTTNASTDTITINATDTNTTYTAGQGLALDGTAFSVQGALSGTLLRFLTVSGSVLKAKDTLASSGTLVFEGAASGSSLYLGTSLDGAGLSSCSAAGQKLLWSSAAKRFSCGTDADTDTTYVAGQGLTLNGDSFRLNATVTGSLLRALTTLASSGTLVFEGAGSGSSLYVATSFNGAGLSDCDAASSKLVWDASTGRFSCGLDGGNVYSAGQGLTLNGSAFAVNATLTGALAEFSTLSGALTRGQHTLASSGSLVWEGAASGATLYVATSIQGAGLVDCDLATQTLAWDASTGRFSCGTDSDTTYTAAQGLTLNGTAFRLNASHTGTLIQAATTLASSGTLVFEGAASGSSLFLGSSLAGAGLTDCDNATTSKLLWDLSTGRFSCGTDQNTGTGNWSNTGSLQTAFDDRYVNTSGDAMTGALVMNPITDSTTLLQVNDADGGRPVFNVDSTNERVGLNTASPAATLHVSGAVLLSNNHPLRFYNTTGTAIDSLFLATDNRLYVSNAVGILIRGSTALDHYISMDSGGDVGIGRNVVAAGSKLALSGSMIVNPTGNTDVTANTRIALEVLGTMSGRIVRAQDTLASSGSLVFEGAASGSSLYLGTSLEGAGLTDCDADNQTVSWDSTGKRFGCGDDDTGGSSVSAGQGLSLNAGVLTLNSIITGSLLEFTAVSGALVYGKNTVASSGSLVWEGAASGATLYLGGKLEGAGLTDCDLAGQTLNWDATTGRFSCGTDADTDTTYTAGQGLVLLGTSFRLNSYHSGTTIWALNTLASSGTLVFEGTGSGNALFIQKNLSVSGALAVETTAHIGTDLFVADDLEVSSDLTVLDDADITGDLGVDGSTAIGTDLDVGGQFTGAGLTDCDTAGTSKLLWDDATGLFSCGTDQSASVTAGQGLTVAGSSIRLNAYHSGTTIWATNTLASSGTLVFEGTGSGNALFIMKNLSVSGALAVDGAATLNNGLTVTGTASATDFSCTDCLDYAELSDTLALDAATITTLGNFAYTLNMDSVGDIFIQESSNTIALFQDNGLITFNQVGNATTDFNVRGDNEADLFYTDASTDRVGIGTSSPDALLDVEDGPIRISNTADSTSFELAIDSGGNYVYLDIFGVGRYFRFAYDGKVGFGNITPNDAALEVLGTMSGSALTVGGGSTVQRIQSATATLDFALTSAANACSADLTITVPGAADGDTVSIGVPNGSLVATSMFFGWVSAANTVTVRHCTNGTAGNPASGTFRAMVTKF